MQGKWHSWKSIDPVSKNHSKPVKGGIQHVPFYTSTIGKHPASSIFETLKSHLNANMNAMKQSTKKICFQWIIWMFIKNIVTVMKQNFEYGISLNKGMHSISKKVHLML
jgi:hypothetical protein